MVQEPVLWWRYQFYGGGASFMVEVAILWCRCQFYGGGAIFIVVFCKHFYCSISLTNDTIQLKH